MKLRKEWIWKEEANFYEHMDQVVHYGYPFYWYRVYGNQIELMKQISKNCAVCQDWNEFITDDQVVESLPVEDMYIDRRSWLTLGAVPVDPIEMISEFVWGNSKTRLEFTPDGQLYCVRNFVDDQLIYFGRYSYNKKKDRYFASAYENSQGVSAMKLSSGWEWQSGKPLITKKYGKRQ